MAGPSTRKPDGGMRTDLGVAFGIVGGAVIGSLLLALTGDVLWLSIGLGTGLLAGIAVAALVSGRDDRGDEQDAGA